MKLVVGALLMVALLGGCSREEAMESQALRTYDIAPSAEPPGFDGEPDQEPAGPQIAYTYGLAYTLSGKSVEAVQTRHIAACRQLAARCIIVATNLQRGVDNDGIGAETRLLVDARLAGSFGQRLDVVATDAGGSLTRREVAAEDVTKQVVDTAARVRAKQALAARLLGLIGNARANVGELVAAEKAFADTQEELDAARSLQATLRQRVAMSAVNIAYTSTEATGAAAPIRRSLSAMGTTLAESVASLVDFVVAVLPWLIALALLVWGLRRLRRRRRARAAAPPAG